jgi:hypothetical protein
MAREGCLVTDADVEARAGTVSKEHSVTVAEPNGRGRTTETRSTQGQELVVSSLCRCDLCGW